jgi:hypothetical protein
MSRDAAIAFMREACRGRRRPRAYGRPDGTLTTADCPVAVQRTYGRYARRIVFAAALLIVAAAGLGFVPVARSAPHSPERRADGVELPLAFEPWARPAGRSTQVVKPGAVYPENPLAALPRPVLAGPTFDAERPAASDRRCVRPTRRVPGSAPVGDVCYAGSIVTPSAALSNGEAVIRSQIFPGAKRCYQHEVEAHPRSSGHLTLAMRVAPNGEVERAAAEDSAPSLRGSLAACVVGVAKRAAFDSPAGMGATLRVPFDFYLQ